MIQTSFSSTCKRMYTSTDSGHRQELIKTKADDVKNETMTSLAGILEGCT